MSKKEQNSAASPTNLRDSAYMGRRRGQRPRVYRDKRKVDGQEVEGPSWMLRWRDDVRHPETGEIKRHRFSTVVAPAEGPGKLSKREAQRLADQAITAKLDVDSLRPGSLMTIEEFVFREFEPFYRSRNKSDHYTTWLKQWVLPALGALRLRDAENSDVQKLILRADRAGKSRQTCKHILATVRALYKHAKRTGIWQGDHPTEFVMLPNKPPEERRALLWGQAETFLERLPDLKALLLFLMVCGPRIGEACGLRRKWVNLSAQEIAVEGVVLPPFSMRLVENWKYYKGGWRYQTLKTQQARIVPLPGFIVAELALHMAASRWQAPEAPVFASSVGTPIDYGNILTRRLKPVAKELGMPWVSWHTFRHTASTLADDVGLAEIDRMQILGQSSGEINRRYTHASFERLRAGLNRIEERMRKKETVQ